MDEMRDPESLLTSRVPRLAPAETAEDRSAGTPPPPKARLRAALTCVLKPLWWIFRPILRPLLWRTRSFFTAPLVSEIAALRASQGELGEQLAALRASQDHLGQELAALRASQGELGEQLLALRTAQKDAEERLAASGARTATAVEEISQGLETALLTIALAPSSKPPDPTASPH